MVYLHYKHYLHEHVGLYVKSAIFICQQILLKIPTIKFHEIGLYDVKNKFGSIKILPITE
jgi:hypothetical protein